MPYVLLFLDGLVLLAGLSWLLWFAGSVLLLTMFLTTTLLLWLIW